MSCDHINNIIIVINLWLIFPYQNQYLDTIDIYLEIPIPIAI